MGIGLKIRHLAEKENLPIVQLAKKLGKTKQSVYEIFEKEDVNTSIVRQCMEIFQVPSSYFFDEAPVSPKVETHGSQSPASVYGNASVASNDNEVEYLKQLLAEKERTIQILMQKQ